MFGWLATWFRKRRNAGSTIQADARRLIAHDEGNAYYNAQRLAARARAHGNAGETLRWIRVAAEIARTSRAEMDIERVKQVTDEELDER